MSEQIKFYKCVKYWLAEDFTIQLKHVRPPYDIETKWISLTKDGILTIREGYAGDGPSGPTLDTKSSFRGAWVHDAGYELMRMGLLDRYTYRKPFDKELRRLCRNDGMPEFRAQLWFESVRLLAEGSSMPGGGKPLLVAP